MKELFLEVKEKKKKWILKLIWGKNMYRRKELIHAEYT